MTIIRKTDIAGSFEEVPVQVQDRIKEIVSNFHYRDGRLNEDGSLGTVRIGVRELNDALAYTFLGAGLR